MSRITDLLSEMGTTTLPQKGMDEGAMFALSRRLMNLLKEYPEPIAIRALEDWPRHNRYFPLEADLVRALDVAQGHERLRQDEALRTFDDGMQDEPTGATLAFLKEFRRINPVKCAAFFDPPAVTRWSEHRIGTRIHFVANIVEKYAPGLLAKHDVRIVEPLRMHDLGRGQYATEWRWS